MQSDNAPINVLLEPVLLVSPARYPIATLLSLLLASPAENPIATLLLPDMLLFNELPPIAIL